MKSGWGIAVIVVAIIWAAVIFAVSNTLEGVPQSSGMMTRERKNFAKG